MDCEKVANEVLMKSYIAIIRRQEMDDLESWELGTYSRLKV